MAGVGGEPAWGVAVVTGLALSAGWYLRDRHPVPFIALPLGTVLVPALAVAWVVDPAIVLSGAHPRLTLDAAARSTHPVVELTDAAARVDLGSAEAATKPAHGRGLPRDYRVAPVVSATWAQPAAVTAWAICDGDEARCEEQLDRTPLVGVVRRGETLASVRGREVVADAVTKHGLRVAEPFLAIEVAARPRLEAAASVAGLVLALLVLGGLAVLVTRLRAAARRAAVPRG